MSHSHHGAHCHDEHHAHGDGEHDHSDDLTPAIQNLLYEQIDIDGIRTLNEKILDTGRAVVRKTWLQREESEPMLESDADEQLLMHVPFTGQVRLHSLHIRTVNTASAPLTLHLHSNRDSLDFESASSISPTQTVTLSQTSQIQDVPVKRQFFNNCRHLTLFFEDNHSQGDEDVTQISYIAFKGDFMRLNREPVEVLYEAAARPSDHKVKGEAADVGMGFGGLGHGRQGF